MTDVLEQLLTLRKKIIECEKKFNRIPGSVALLAVTKGQTIKKMTEALDAGQTRFGENYLQEAEPKIQHFSDKPIEWHFIGQLQRNKTKKISEQFAWVHSVTNKLHAERLNSARPSSLPPLNICLEINISHEVTKSGAKLDELCFLANYCQSLPNLKLRGLMTIPAPKVIFSEQRQPFAELRLLFEKLQMKGFELDTLSMGMSNDWEAAIAEGATIIRIGTAIFGERT